MALIPLGADHADNADQVERSGAGVKVGAGSSPQAIRAGITSVLDDDCFRTAARSLRDEIAVMPQPAAVALVLEQLAGH
jgi:UDP:flavonoid glycosyltransferase YjiC (YdhE family)